MSEEELKKKRLDLICLSAGGVKDKMKYLADQVGLSISGYIRQAINKEYKKEKKKENELASVS